MFPNLFLKFRNGVNIDPSTLMITSFSLSFASSAAPPSSYLRNNGSFHFTKILFFCNFRGNITNFYTDKCSLNFTILL